MTIGGSVGVIENLADLLQVCLDVGAKRVLIPIASAGKIATVPPDLFSKFQISFYGDPIQYFTNWIRKSSIPITISNI